jgi:hypothetical protein
MAIMQLPLYDLDLNAGSPSAANAAAGVMMTGAADVESAAAWEVAASADAFRSAGGSPSTHNLLHGYCQPPDTQLSMMISKTT